MPITDGSKTMFSTIVLCGVVTLLGLSAVNLVAYTHRLFRVNRSRQLDLRPFFWAIGFLPMAIVTISNIGVGSPILMNLLALLRNPFLGIDATVTVFAQIGELSFLMDFITVILLSSTVVITFSRRSRVHGADRPQVEDKTVCKSKHSAETSEEKVVVRPYLCYGCYLS